MMCEKPAEGGFIFLRSDSWWWSELERLRGSFAQLVHLGATGV